MKVSELMSEGTDNELDAVPYDKMQQIKKLIAKGATEQEHNWASALDLVHRAYEVAEVERPEISMKKAWEQYEENIELSVRELQKATDKGIRSDDWKLVSSKLEKTARIG